MFGDTVFKGPQRKTDMFGEFPKHPKKAHTHTHIAFRKRAFVISGKNDTLGKSDVCFVSFFFSPFFPPFFSE